MIATTIEQSNRLLKAGIDPQTADMYYMMFMNGMKPMNGDADLNYTFEAEDGRWYFLEIYEDFFDAGHGEGVHAWSLSALIQLLPEHVFYRLARARGKDVEGLFEDCVKYLCMKSDEQKRHMMATL